MCRETMDTQPRRVKSDCLRKTVKHGSKFGWRLVRMSAEDEALKLWRTTAVKTTVRKYLRREQRRAQLEKLSTALNDGDEEEEKQRVCEESPAAACMHSHPAGAMAPENTTQYLMSKVYEDLRQQPRTRPGPAPASAEIPSQLSLYDGSLSPSCVYKALDSDFNNCLAFQQRDFEEEFGMLW